MCSSFPFLIIPSAPTITGMMVLLRCQIFSISVSRSLYLLILLHSLIDKLISVGTDISIRRNVFLLSYQIYQPLRSGRI